VTGRSQSDGPDEPLELVRAVLGDREAWLVGGLVRDRVLAGEALLPRAVADVDLVVAGDPREVARALARAGSGTSFPLSEELGSWRVVARGGRWQIDVELLRGGAIEADLALRDFTVNAVAQSLDGSRTIDPLGGLQDLADRRLRMAGPRAFVDDPLRVLRLVRQAVDFDLRPDDGTMRGARAAANDLAAVSAERVFAELKLIIDGPDPLRGLGLMGEVGASAVVMPELEALRGVEQSRYHHRDVHGHTLEVLQRTVELCRTYLDPEAGRGDRGEFPDGELHGPLVALLSEPLADGLTRAGALRWGALLHDAAKPLTRAVGAGGRVTFLGHDVRGAELARSALSRLRASERLRGHVAGLVRNHLRLGFLVHEPKPLARRTVYEYLCACGSVGVDVTLLSIADRLATRGDRADEAIEAHLALARAMLADALHWRAQGPPRPLLRGDELAGELGIPPGPDLGRLLESLRAAQFAGEVKDRAQALARARAELASERGHA
jgi:putative nucleotidyltransferase with HDIG domain